MNVERVAELGRQLLVELGEDPDREGLVDTPMRWARWWKEFIDYDPGKVCTTFESIAVDQMVVLRGVRVWSLCEHHLLPFYCDLAIGYIAADKVLGLSKMARIAQAVAHRLQIQERLVEDIATAVATYADTEDVAVIASGEHLCMTMRGVRTKGQMVSSALRGRFMEGSPRAEFLNLARG